jgi:hypothetical protein
VFDSFGLDRWRENGNGWFRVFFGGECYQWDFGQWRFFWDWEATCRFCDRVFAERSVYRYVNLSITRLMSALLGLLSIYILGIWIWVSATVHVKGL